MGRSEVSKASVLTRLKKIEGQIKGIQNMIEEDKCCNEVMIQISAARSAINCVGGILLEAYIKDCVVDSLKSNKETDVENMIDTIVKFTK